MNLTFLCLLIFSLILVVHHQQIGSAAAVQPGGGPLLHNSRTEINQTLIGNMKSLALEWISKFESKINTSSSQSNNEITNNQIGLFQFQQIVSNLAQFEIMPNMSRMFVHYDHNRYIERLDTIERNLNRLIKYYKSPINDQTTIVRKSLLSIVDQLHANITTFIEKFRQSKPWLAESLTKQLAAIKPLSIVIHSDHRSDGFTEHFVQDFSDKIYTISEQVSDLVGRQLTILNYHDIMSKYYLETKLVPVRDRAREMQRKFSDQSNQSDMRDLFASIVLQLNLIESDFQHHPSFGPTQSTIFERLLNRIQFADLQLDKMIEKYIDVDENDRQINRTESLREMATKLKEQAANFQKMFADKKLPVVSDRFQLIVEQLEQLLNNFPKGHSTLRYVSPAEQTILDELQQQLLSISVNLEILIGKYSP